MLQAAEVVSMDAGPGVASSVDNIMERVGLKDRKRIFLFFFSNLTAFLKHVMYYWFWLDVGTTMECMIFTHNWPKLSQDAHHSMMLWVSILPWQKRLPRCRIFWIHLPGFHGIPRCSKAFLNASTRTPSNASKGEGFQKSQDVSVFFFRFVCLSSCVNLFFVYVLWWCRVGQV